jgi:hypothetical protein
MKKVCGLIKKFLNVKQHYKLAKTEHPGWVKFTKRYLVCAVVFVLLGTSLTTWLEGSDDPVYKYEILSWAFLALLPLTPLFIFLLMYLAAIGTLLYCVVIFSPIWIPLLILINFDDNNKLKKENKRLEEEKKLIAITDAIMQNKYREIGIEQEKPENKLYVEAPSGIYFDGTKIIIKCDNNTDLIKTIKGLSRCMWSDVLLAWVCNINEFAGVLGIARRYSIPIDETFLNLHPSTDAYADVDTPGSNLEMLKLHNDGTLPLSTKKIMKIDKGYVYLIRAKGQNLYKIGKSIHPEKRVKAIMGGLPMETEAIHCAWFEDHGYAESQFHDIFSEKRQGGEWFILNEQDVSMIMSIGQKYDLNPTDKQLEDRARFEENRRKNYKNFKQREQKRNRVNNGSI